MHTLFATLTAILRLRFAPRRQRLPWYGLLLLPLLLAGCSKSTVYIAPETPFFSEPSIASNVIAVSEAEGQLPVLDTKREYIEHNPVLKGQWHPLMVYTDFRKVSIGENVHAWVSEDILFDKQTGMPITRLVPRQHYQFLFVAALGATILLGAYAVSRGHAAQLFVGDALPPRQTRWITATLLLLVYFTLLFAILFFAGNTTTLPTNEEGYFRIAQDLLDGKIGTERWCFTISIAVFYIPLMLLCDAKTYYDILTPVVLTQSMVLAPACFLLAFLIFQKLTNSTRRAALAVLLWIVLPFFYFPLEYHAGSVPGSQVFKAFFAMPVFGPTSYHVYYHYVWTGYNGLCDTPATFLALLCVWLGLAMRPGMKMISAVSLMFGLACFMRMNNIFFAPLVAYLFWYRMKDDFTDPVYLTKAFFLAVGLFLLVFSPQLIANRVQFGSIWTTPYILHNNDAAKGFEWYVLPGGSEYLINCNYLFMVIGAVGLMFLRNKHVKIVLTLWSVPTILFFCGYTVVGASPMRFTLAVYPALFAALVCAEDWREFCSKEQLAAAVLIGAGAILVSPPFRFTPPHPFYLDLTPTGQRLVLWLNALVPVGSVLLAAAFIKGKRALLLTVTYLVLYHAGSHWLVLAAFVVSQAQTIVFWASDLLAVFSSAPAQERTAAP